MFKSNRKSVNPLSTKTAIDVGLNCFLFALKVLSLHHFLIVRNDVNIALILIIIFHQIVFS